MMQDRNHWVYVLAKFEQLFELGLGAHEMRVYIALRSMQLAHPISMTDMAVNLKMSLSTMSKCCWRLYNKELVTYEYSDTDRRRVVVMALPLPRERVQLQLDPDCPKPGCPHRNRPNHGNPCFCKLEEKRLTCLHPNMVPAGVDKNEFPYCPDCGLVNKPEVSNEV